MNKRVIRQYDRIFLHPPLQRGRHGADKGFSNARRMELTSLALFFSIAQPKQKYDRQQAKTQHRGNRAVDGRPKFEVEAPA